MCSGEEGVSLEELPKRQRYTDACSEELAKVSPRHLRCSCRRSSLSTTVVSLSMTSLTSPIVGLSSSWMVAACGVADAEARIFVFFLLACCVLCESMQVSECSFYLALTGTVCLLRFDGTGFFYFVLCHLAYVDLYWSLSTSFQEVTCKLRALQHFLVADFLTTLPCCKAPHRNSWVLHQVLPWLQKN